MLDLNSNLTLLDLYSGKLKLRNKVSCGVEAFSWGVLSEGSGLNSVCVGARKSFGLVDIRAGSLEQAGMYKAPYIFPREGGGIKSVREDIKL